MHAWYSRKSHEILSEMGGESGTLWYVNVGGEQKLATLIADDADVCKWEDAVYLGNIDGEVLGCVDAASVPVIE